MRTLAPAAGRQRMQRRCRTGLLRAPPRHHPGRGDLRWWWCQPGGPRRWRGEPARARQRVDPRRRGARGSPCPGTVQHGRQAPLPWQGPGDGAARGLAPVRTVRQRRAARSSAHPRANAYAERFLLTARTEVIGRNADLRWMPLAIGLRRVRPALQRM